MTDYRRNRVPGATYFLTINLFDRRSSLLVERITLVREAVRQVRRERPFHIDAWVVLPEHMHCLWTLPARDTDFSTRIRLIKTIISKGIETGEARSASRVEKKERGLWQWRFWEHTIRDDRDYAAHMDYIHFNPVHHGLTDTAIAWPFSTLRSAIARGVYPSAWAGTTETIDVGERA